MIIPDYVDGIPTEKRRSAERRKLNKIEIKRKSTVSSDYLT
jgi:hypothetical protein